MISAFIEYRDDPEGLARTLASLVPAAVEGVVKDAFVFARERNGDVAAVTEVSGAVLLAGQSPSQAAEHGRGEWLLLLEAGATLEDGWTAAARSWGGTREAPARFRRVKGSFFARVWPRGRPLASGLLIRRDRFRSVAASSDSLGAVASGRAAGKLDARIVPARP
ncbi:glycosyl transferase family 2 [Faunimonas sp. B44]|uniref:glycosyl transferase family 2 n=1 Tax=Faunimonas sp. B44 TaxID=3461493 RepID=UPI004044A5D2